VEIVKSMGIILKEINYSESSKILTVFTKEYGKIGILSKGCRNIRSKLRSVSTRLIYGFFHFYYQPNGLSTLICVDVENTFSHILSSIDDIAYANYLLELTDKIVEGDAESDLFDLLISTLEKIEEGITPKMLSNIFSLKVLPLLGCGLVLDECVSCGSSENIVTIDIEQGGFICKKCYANQMIVDPKLIQLLRLSMEVDVKKIKKLSLDTTLVDEFSKFLDDYYEKYTGISLKSKTFLKNIMKLGVSNEKI